MNYTFIVFFQTLMVLSFVHLSFQKSDSEIQQPSENFGSYIEPQTNAKADAAYKDAQRGSDEEFDQNNLRERHFGQGITLGGGCSDYVIISARGTSESQILPVGSAGYIKGVLGAVPNGAIYEVQYEAALDFYTGPVRGARDAGKFLRQQLASCPKQVYALFGFSEGAMVITQFLRTQNVSPAEIASVVFYGNPFHLPGEPQNKCTGISGTGIGAVQGVRLPQQFAEVTFDCCLQGDSVCQTIGTMIPHLAYSHSQSEQQAISFTANQLQSRIAKGAGGHYSRPQLRKVYFA